MGTKPPEVCGRQGTACLLATTVLVHILMGDAGNKDQRPASNFPEVPISGFAVMGRDTWWPGWIYQADTLWPVKSSSDPKLSSPALPQIVTKQSLKDFTENIAKPSTGFTK